MQRSPSLCQLPGMNCNVPADICFSFTGFQARGGATNVHRDGWSIAFPKVAGCLSSLIRSLPSPLPVDRIVMFVDGAYREP
ncbi:class II glutamine amidotransferase [Georgfuchsia toluolica]|uniref:class II glutamine amidotransferase n=1 Tax=Georgfuchsia toluolica TaxID=424218 RepID=UPI002484B6A6|nr:class II glutamine amidotransferase [Georgfuchsia toluolica]